MRQLITAVVCAVCVAATDAWAQEDDEGPPESQPAVETKVEQLSETRHSIVVDGRELD